MTPRTFINVFALTTFSWAAATFWALTALVSTPQTPLAMAHDHKEPLEITGAWARATPTGSKVAAAYFTITSHQDDVLLSASSSAAGRTELHQTTQDVNGALQMRELAAGIDLPAHASVTLAPGGTHVMLMDLKNPLKEGFEVPLTLNFKQAGQKNIRVMIKPVSYMPGIGADSMPHTGEYQGEQGHQHHDHSHHGHHH